ncbi:MAG: rRNA maturation RNase YbeY [Kiritimatiellia bacterium]|jgi:probable rRNA maturation factor
MQYLMEQAARLNPHRKWQSVSVVLLDDAGISRINRLYLDREHVTDVISFATPTVVPADGWQGEIFVNVQRACEVGEGRRGGAQDELALYLAHGVDHLTGSGDYTPADQKRMRRRELRWLAGARAKGLLGRLLIFD